MSIHVLSNVMRESEALGGQRLVLFVLAEFAHDDGTRAFPDVATLSERTRLTRRQVQRCLRALESEQRIWPTGTTRTGTTVWTVALAPTESDHAARKLRTPPDGGRKNVAPGGDICDIGGRNLRPNRGVLSTPDPTTDPPGTPISSGKPDDSAQRNSRDTVATADVAVVALCARLAAKIADRDPRFPTSRATSSRWLRDMRLLLKDRQGAALEVREVLDWSQADAFWGTNVLSPNALRRNFPALLMQMRAGRGGTRHHGKAGGRFDQAAGLS